MPGYDDDSQELFQQKPILHVKCFQQSTTKWHGQNYSQDICNQLWMHSQYGQNLRLICPCHPKDSMKGVDCMPMVPPLSWKGTTEECVLHFHEQFRQLDELTPLDEQLPHSVRSLSQIDSPTDSC